jgi:hypothetical protein
MKYFPFYILLSLFLLTACHTEMMPDWSEILTNSLYQPEDIDYGVDFPSIAPEMDADFNARYFRPWHVKPDSLAVALENVPGPDETFLPKYLDDPEYYGENKRRHSDKRRRQLKEKVDFSGFPSVHQQGITIRHTNIRRLPIAQPGYDRYDKAGEGFPFDYFQETALWANAPVLVLHKSTDGAWSYVLTASYKGWIPTNDLALTDEKFMKEWERGQYCAVMTDEIAVHSKGGRFLFTGKLGMLLPHVPKGDDASTRQVYAAVSNANGQAVIKTCQLNNQQVLPKPLPFDGKYLQRTISELHGNPYGWGGFWENRDCSSSIKDLYVPFGIWVPRNSADQAHCGKTTIELPEDSDQKLALIKEKGVPFLTILYKRGHAMLYVGLNEEGEPLIFHTVWGLKSYHKAPGMAVILKKYPLEGMHFNEDKELFESRKIIGQTAITTLTIGEEDLAIRRRIIDELTFMTVLVDSQ